MSLFGKKGIDTSYERDLFERRVKLTYPEKDGSFWLPSDSFEGVQRARDFNITNVIEGYESLLERIDIAMQFIEKKKSDILAFKEFSNALQMEGYKQKAMNIELDNSKIRDDSYFELYSLLFRLKKSVETQIDFQYDNYAAQFIEGRSLEDLELVESNSISRMADLMAEPYRNAYEDDHDHEDQEQDEELKQKIIRELNLLHITNGDIAYSHLNRHKKLDIILTSIENNTYSKNELLGSNIEHLIQSIYAMQDKESLKVHLLTKFSNVRAKHDGSKNKYKAISADVEKYASEVAFAQKKIKEVATENTTKWLYEQEGDVSESLDGLASLLVDGIVLSERNYENALGSMTQLYVSEAEYFSQQVSFIQEKEKIRLYFRIIEELEDKSSLDSEWIINYLLANGYSTSVEV